MARNINGAIRHPNLEWGRKARKAETRLRGLNASARRDAIAEQWGDDS